MFGAIHSGRRLTEAFHCMTTKTSVSCHELRMSVGER